MSLDLSPEVETVVRDRAQALGVSVNDLLARTFAPEKTEAKTVNDPEAHIQALLARWQTEDNTPILPPIPTLPGETPTQALFRKWAEEDARMTDEEREAEDQLWEDIDKGLRENGGKLRLRYIATSTTA